VFGRLEKAPDFNLRNGFFWVKMPLFALILALEIFPMLTFIRWRVARSRGGASGAGAKLAVLIALNDAEVAIVLLIPFIAALMARDAWLF
jgi:putative membrane protein